ncbi:hypothetical protein GC194_02065 [bacterium]|nr:hypothetical protein [bacterium]
MKQNLIAVFAILLSVTAYAQDSKVTGFRDLVWGIHRDSVYSNGTKVKFVKDKEATEPNAYVIENDNLTLGAAKLTKITYFFNKDDRFKKVIMYSTSKYQTDIKDILVFKFGGAKNVKDPTPVLKVSEWQVGDVSLNLTQNSRDEIVTLSIESNWDLTRAILVNMNVNDIVYDGKKVSGFRSLKWLEHKDSIYASGEKIHFVKDKNANQPNTYYLVNEKLAFGSVRLTGISYFFNDDDHFTKVVMRGSKSNYGEVKFILNHKFGGAEDVNVFGDDMSVTEWKIGDVTIKLTDSGTGDEFSLIVESSKDKTESYMKNRNVGDF